MEQKRYGSYSREGWNHHVESHPEPGPAEPVPFLYFS